VSTEDIFSGANIALVVGGAIISYVLKGIYAKMKDDWTNIEKRIDKLEENSRSDDEQLKELISDSEGRQQKEMERRIKNVKRSLNR